MCVSGPRDILTILLNCIDVISMVWQYLITGVPEWISSSLNSSLSHFLEPPLRQFFMHGPHWLHCLGGLSVTDACAQITCIPASHWIIHQKECDMIIQSRYEVIHSMFVMAIFCWLCIMICSIILNEFSYLIRHLVRNRILKRKIVFTTK